MDLLRLAEYEHRRIPLSQSQAKRLADTGYISVVPDAEPGWWQVTAGHHVGTLVIDDLHIFIRPKVRLENLFLLLSVGLREKDWGQAPSRFATDNDLLPAVVSFFARQVDITLTRGIFRSYREEQDRLKTIRGRIDLRTQITRAGVFYPVDCLFGEYTADVIENRYLKAATRRALRVPRVRPWDRQRLLRILSTLEEVRDVAVRPDDLDRVTFDRLNRRYEPALQLARMLLENLTLEYRKGETVAWSFMVDMNLLFERFVTDRLQRALRGRLEVKSQYSTYLARGDKVRIRPDLLLRHRGEPVLVVELKYKQVDEQWDVSTSNYYQLLAYTAALNLPEGMLIYCRDTDVQGSEHDLITVRHVDKVLHVWRLDMSVSPSEVESELRKLSDWIAERTNRMVAITGVSPGAGN